MSKDTKYLQFPLCLMQNLFTDKKGTMGKIFDAGIYNLSINPKFASDQSQAGRQVSIIKNIMKSFETNIGKDLVFSLYKDVLSTPSFSFATIPGYYSQDEDRLYYYPDIPGFKLLRNQEIMKYINQDKNKKPQVIY